MNASHLELISQATDMGSAISTDRKNGSLGLYHKEHRNSLGPFDLDPVARRKSALERK